LWNVCCRCKACVASKNTPAGQSMTAEPTMPPPASVPHQRLRNRLRLNREQGSSHNEGGPDTFDRRFIPRSL
jgi:hypothetical protein